MEPQIKFRANPRYHGDGIPVYFGSSQDSLVTYDGTNDEWTVETKDSGGTQTDRVRVKGNADITTVELYNDDPGATGIRLDVHHDSASQADNDVVFHMRVYGNDDAGTPVKTQYGGLKVTALDTTDASEDGKVTIEVMTAGTLRALDTPVITADDTIAVLGLAQTFTADQTLNDSVKLTLGTGGDADIYYDGTNLVIEPRVVGSGNTVINDVGILFLNETANANMTTGITINQGAEGDQILAFKSSDVTTGLTTATVQGDVETDDFFTVHKKHSTLGGVHFNIMAEELADPFMVEVYGGAPPTTDISSTGAPIQFYVAEHDQANALQDMAANSNAFAVGEITAGGSRTVRLLLKADDGELHLGNTTLVALDEEDDRQIVRAMQKVGSSSGIVPSKYDNPFYDYDWLLSKGLADPVDDEGFFMFAVQSRLHAHEGAMWQNYIDIQDLREERREMQDKIAFVENRLQALEAP